MSESFKSLMKELKKEGVKKGRRERSEEIACTLIEDGVYTTGYIASTCGVDKGWALERAKEPDIELV